MLVRQYDPEKMNIWQKGDFPNQNALLKLLYLRVTELYQKWGGRPVPNWAIVRNQLAMDDAITTAS